MYSYDVKIELGFGENRINMAIKKSSPLNEEFLFKTLALSKIAISKYYHFLRKLLSHAMYAKRFLVEFKYCKN